MALKSITVPLDISKEMNAAAFLFYRGDNVEFTFTFSGSGVDTASATKLRVIINPIVGGKVNTSEGREFIAGEADVASETFVIAFTSGQTAVSAGNYKMAVILLDADNEVVTTAAVPIRILDNGYTGIFTPSEDFRDEVMDALTASEAARDAAQGYATTATTQAGVATTQAGISTTKASEASGSAAAALESKNAAAQSKTDCESAQAAAEAAALTAELNASAAGIVPAGLTDVHIQAACDLAGDGGVVRLTPGATYTVSGSITLPPGGTLVGYGATLKRCDHVAVTLTATVAGNSNTLQVSSVPSNWRVGRTRLTISTQSGYNGQNALDSSSNMAVIAAISGTTVTLDRNIQLPADGSLAGTGVYPIGASVVNVSPQIIFNGGGNVLGVTFDGQRTQYIPRDWLLLNCIVGNSATSRRKRVIDCNFKNIPGSCIVSCGSLWVSGCDAEYVSGSLVHMSCSNDTYRGFFLVNNCGRSCNTDATIMGHEEALFTFSWAPNGVHIQGNDFVDCGGQVFGPVVGQNYAGEIVVSGNTFKNFAGGFGLIRFSAAQDPRNTIIVEGNSFYNCGDIAVQTTTVSTYIWRGVTIRNNIIYGGRILAEMNSPALIDISGNQLYQGGYTFTTNSLVSFSQGAISCAARRSYIFGNKLYGSASPGVVSWGILIARNTDITDTRFASADSIVIRGNVIERFATGIGPYAVGNPGSATTFKCVEVSDNTIYIDGNNVGIYAHPGFVVKGNTVLAKTTGGTPVILTGVANSTTFDSARRTVAGPIVANNVLLCPTGGYALKLGVSWSGALCSMTAVNNMLAGAIADYSAAAFCRIGSGTNGVITVTAASTGTTGNALSIRCVAGSGNNVAMSAAIASNLITVTLGTNSGGTLDATKNTAALIAAAVDALAEVVATASGDGSGVFSDAVSQTYLSGGSLIAGNQTLPFAGIDTAIATLGNY